MIPAADRLLTCQEAAEVLGDLDASGDGSRAA